MLTWSSSSYCNSILQCLYYTVPFRDQVINYPKKSPLELINAPLKGLPRLNTNTGSAPTAQSPLSPARAKAVTASSARNPGGPAPSPKPDDKEMSDLRKKSALAKGPVLNMVYENTAIYGMPESLFTALKDIFEAISANQSRTGVVSPTKFLEVLRRDNEMFRTVLHQDAHEFLNLLLNEVVANVEVNAKKLEAENEMNGSAEMYSFEKVLASAMSNMAGGTRTPTNTGWVHELFEGTLTSETKCLTCENISQRDEVFLDLSVDLDQHSSVTSCLRKFSAEEMLCERNKFHCDRCGDLQEAEKRMKIKRLPKILALHLKRFKYTEDLQRLQKLFHRVVYPYHLRLFNTTDDAEDPDRLYELYAVVVHIGGGPYHGHYVSIIKTQDRGWLLFDDELVEPVDKSFVRNFFGDRPGLACAYVLFYQETTLEAVKREQDAERPVEPARATENVGLGLKTNGVSANGNYLAKSPVSPTSEEGDRWDSIDKVKIEPAPPTKSSSDNTFASSATTPLTPGLPSPKADVQSKKERAKEEKERKAAEREQEKADRAMRKALDQRKKENEKKPTSDGKTAPEANKSPTKLEPDSSVHVEADNRASNGVGGGGGSTGISAGLSRFRATSKSISKRSMMWISKDSSSKDESAIVEDGVEPPPPPPLSTTIPVPEKPKNRFSLRRKPSNMML